MFKRFTDCHKWQDPWFRKLPLEYKHLWLYICDHCDNAGVWKEDIETASYFIGADLTVDSAIQHLGSRIQVLRPGYWLIKQFVGFQFGLLSADSPLHKAILKLISKHTLALGYPYPSIRVQEKDKDKEEVKTLDVKDKQVSKEYLIPDPNIDPAKCLVLTYKTTKGFAFDDRNWDKANWGRCAQASKTLLGLCKTLSVAESCLKDLGEEYNTKGLSWTLETIARNAGEWLKKNGRIDENASRAGLRMAIAERKRKGTGEEGLAQISEGQILGPLRDREAPEKRDQSNAQDGARKLHVGDVD